MSTMFLTKLHEDTIFQKNWQTYQIIVKENYIQHKTLYANVPKYLLKRFPTFFTVLDLGCGDVDFLTKIFDEHNFWSHVSSYTGVDLSEQAMQLGEQNVRSKMVADTQQSFVVDNMLNFVQKSKSAVYDLVFASFAVHHLQDNEKEQLVREVRRLLKPNGTFMVIDVFLQEDENREDYLRNFIADIRNNWIKLNAEQKESFVNHVFSFDFPAKLKAYEQWAKQDSLYTNVYCLESLQFTKTIVLEV